MAFTQYLDNKILDLIFGATTYTVPTNLYVGLSTTTPTSTGTNITEPSGANYSRPQVTNDTATGWNASTGTPSTKTNKGAITFPTASGAWGGSAVTHFFIADSTAAVGTTNVLAWGALNTPQTVANGDTLSFAAGQLSIQLT